MAVVASSETGYGPNGPLSPSFKCTPAGIQQTHIPPFSPNLHCPEPSFFLASGQKSGIGRRPKMEDISIVEPALVTLDISYKSGETLIPQALLSSLGSCKSLSPIRHIISSAMHEKVGGQRRVQSTYQYGAVFDGHGGSKVSWTLARELHLVMSRELINLSQEFRTLTLAQVEGGIKRSFVQMDEKFEDSSIATEGSTGVVSLISAQHIIVANCGDSRAVLFRGNSAWRLSRDHKPSESDEQDRVNNAGGYVAEYNGKRVMGLLAMSRAFGDHCLKKYGITAEPEVTIIERDSEDEFIILASDGLWDVIRDSEACELAQRCFIRAKERNAPKDTAARVAASVLMRAALDKGSSDNITVVIIDLSL